MPESRHRYLYERLGDHDFQQLVSAVLANQFPDYIHMALRQADEGRDGKRKIDASKVLIYQVKWSVNGKEKDPVSWLDQAVRSERGQPATPGRTRRPRLLYVLVTNVGSTAKPESGTFDQLDKKLEAHAKDFGYEQMSCIWREALHPRVDNAPTETKWAYADMLAGWDPVRYLVAEHVGAGKDKAHRDLIRKVAAAQWEDDKRVKFSQSDVDREKKFVRTAATAPSRSRQASRPSQPPTRYPTTSDTRSTPSTRPVNLRTKLAKVRCLIPAPCACPHDLARGYDHR